MRELTSVAVGRERAREHAEEVDAAGERVGDRLEDERGRPAAVDVHGERLLGRRRDALDEQVEEARGAEVLRRDAARDREELARDDGVLERGGELVAGDLLVREVALHDRLVRLDDGLDELHAVLLGLGGDVVRDRGGLRLAVGAGIQVGAHVEEVDDALQLVLVPDRDLHGDAALGELRAELLERGEEVRALAVEHGHEDDAAEVELLRALPEAGRLHLDAVDAVDGHQRSLDHAERGERVGLEARVAGRVDEVDLALVPLQVAERGRQRHLAAVLVVVPVGDRGRRFDGPEAVGGTRLEEHRLDQRGLPGPPVSDHGDVPDLARLEGRHGRRV